MMILDSHVHATEASSALRPHDPKGSPAHTLLVEQLLKDADEAGVDKIVQVVPSAMGFDNSYAFEIAKKYDRVAAVVIRFDPFAPDPEGRLRAIIAENPKMTGVRFTLTSPEGVQSFLEGKLDPFFAIAEKVGTAIQLFAPFESTAARKAVRKYPKLRWLIDHMGLRYTTGKDNSQAYRDWPALIELAKEPNAWVKVSYFPEASKDLESYPYPLAQRYFQELYEKAGAARLIWGSNYPPVVRACTYKQSVDFMTECTFIKPEDREPIMSGNFLKSFT